MCTSRLKVYFKKSRIDLSEQIKTKSCFILYDDKIKYTHNNGKNYLGTNIPKKFENWNKKT